MRTLYLILNPQAARGGAESAWAAAEPVLTAAGARWQLARTTAPGEAESLARAAARAGIWDAVVAIGGDGTVHEVVNGLLGAADGPALGILPAGSGNDFARAAGIPVGDPAAALRAMLEGDVRSVDVGRVNGRYFVNGMGWGLDGRVAVQIARRRRFAGRAMYLAALLSALRGQRPAHVDICLDGRTVPGFVTLIAVTNGPCYGGGFRICPHARIDDGQLDLCVADAMSRLSILRLVPRVMRGTHLGHPRVWYARGTTVTLTSRIGLPAHADGEVIDAAATRLEVAVVPGGVRMVGAGGGVS
jgi:diacylglycerol kinase (ATP)